MKKYDFQKAKHLIEKHREEIVSASLGMHEDWFGTAEMVFSDGEYKVDLDTVEKIGNLDGSTWATPVLELEYLDGRAETFACHDDGASEPQTYIQSLIMDGPLSGEMNRFRSSIPVKSDDPEV